MQYNDLSFCKLYNNLNNTAVYVFTKGKESKCTIMLLQQFSALFITWTLSVYVTNYHNIYMVWYKSYIIQNFLQ